jgi:hypothetical protein
MENRHPHAIVFSLEHKGRGEMKLGKEPHKIINVDRLENGVIVTFASGEVALFDGHFLFDHKSTEQNRVIAEAGVDADDEESAERKSA